LQKNWEEEVQSNAKKDGLINYVKQLKKENGQQKKIKL
jgi:hypothetical protein